MTPLNEVPVPKGLVFISMPFNHIDPEVVKWRMETFWKTMGTLVDSGIHAISPMTMEPSTKYSKNEIVWSVWEGYCKSMMAVSEEVWVLTMPGYELSTGVAGEVAYANELGKPVRYISVN